MTIKGKKFIISNLLSHLSALWLLCLPVLAAAPHYRLIDLGILPGYQKSYATCLNDKGEVAGYLISYAHVSQTTEMGSQACFWSGRRVHLLRSQYSVHAARTMDSVASGINNRGQVVGTLSDVFSGAWIGKDLQGVIWNHNKVISIPIFNESTAIAINDKGQVTGTSDIETAGNNDLDYPHIFKYSHGEIVDLGAGCATGINNAGTISGFELVSIDGRPTCNLVAMNDDPQYHALLCLANGTRRILKKGYILNINSSVAIGTNVAGIEQPQQPQLRTFLANDLEADIIAQDKSQAHHKIRHPHIAQSRSSATKRGKMLYWKVSGEVGKAHVLPFHWIPQSINDSGDIVGSHYLYQAGHVYDLNTITSPRRGWNIVCATAVNKRGQIAGWGRYDGKTRAFLLIPY